MVMKQSIQTTPSRPTRIGVADAKSRLSELLRRVADGPTIIHSRGRDIAVVLSIEEYNRLQGETAAQGGGARWLDRIEALKRRLGWDIEDFDPPHIKLKMQDPFARE